MSKIIIGVDNGLDGGIVGLSLDGKVVINEIMPTIDGEKKRTYDIPSMVRVLRGLEVGAAYLERAQAMPGQGVSSMFSIGYGFGLWQGLMTALEIPFVVVGPKAWQKVIFEGVDKTDTKKASALVAQRLHPEIDWRATERCRTIHDGKTDAYGIAEYGRREYLKTHQL